MKNCVGIILSKMKWPQNKLAKKVGVDRSTINMVISGKLNPSLRLAFAIAMALECKIDEIFFPSAIELFGDNNGTS